MELHLNRQNVVGLGLVGFYLVFAFFIPIVSYIFGLDTQTWHIYIASVIAHLILAILIWIERDQLGSFHVDRKSLGILIWFAPLLILQNRPENVFVYTGVLILISIGIDYTIRSSQSNIPETKFNIQRHEFFWILALLSVALAIGILDSFPRTFEIGNPIQEIFAHTNYNLAFAATVEEFFFRAFLWGYLLKLGLNQRQAFWAQAAIFWVVHIDNHWQSPLILFVLVPLGTLVFSLTVYRKKTSVPRHSASRYVQQYASNFIGTICSTSCEVK